MNLRPVSDARLAEFGVGIENSAGEHFVRIPVDAAVQDTLKDMVVDTWNALHAASETPALYEPSEKHSGVEHLYLPLTNPLAARVRHLHEAVNLPLAPRALDDPSDVFCYFAHLQYANGSRVTGLRRANQFKAVLKSRNRLVRVLDNTLTVIEDDVFKLDMDFDVLVVDAIVHVLRPSGFEFAGKLQQAILDAAPMNVDAIAQDLPFVDFDQIVQYASNHPRAARYVASIRSQTDLEFIDKSLLKRLCKQTGVNVAELKGVISVSAGHELAFLEVLDRRRYEVMLVKEQPEKYRAASRTKI